MNFCDLAESVAKDKVPYTRFRLEERRNDSLTARVACTGDKTVILKLWKRPGIQGKIRQLTRTGNLDREWKALGLLYNKGICVPEALACFRFNRPKNGFTDALVIQDLGSCKRIVDVIPEYIQKSNGTPHELIKLENKIINLTQSILEAGVIDFDHHLVNILLLPSNHVARVDFELSSIFYRPKLHKYKLAKMIANLLTSYIYSTQYNIDLINSFSIRLNQSLVLSPKVLQHVNILVNKDLQQQQKIKPGLMTSWVAPW